MNLEERVKALTLVAHARGNLKRLTVLADPAEMAKLPVETQKALLEWSEECDRLAEKADLRFVDHDS